MLLNKDIVVLKKILAEIQVIDDTVGNATFSVFDKTETIKRTVAMTMINIGELTRHLSEDFKKSEKEIPFKAIMATRHVAAHEYQELRFDDIWEAVKKDIPKMKKRITFLLK